MMKRRIKNKDAAHLSRKIRLYESFLYGYLPQLASLSFITRINLFDWFGNAGLDRLGSQGTPFVIFEALRKQRLHQLKHKLPLKPLSLSLATALENPATPLALQQLQAENTLSNTCKIDCWQLPLQESLKKLFRQLQQQPAGERNLLLVDPLGIPNFSMADLQLLSRRRVELILFLPLAALWQLHQKPEKTATGPELLQLKKQLDSLFPAEHEYWCTSLNPTEFMDCLKQGLTLQDDVFTALEPLSSELPEAALFALSHDAFMMEKLLSALQRLRPAAAPLQAGRQLPIFQAQAAQTQNTALPPADTSELLALLQEQENITQIDNQEIYKKGLQKGLLPAQLYQGLHSLFSAGKIEVLDEKNKVLQELPAQCISFTAFKAPKIICYFRMKD